MSSGSNSFFRVGFIPCVNLKLTIDLIFAEKVTANGLSIRTC